MPIFTTFQMVTIDPKFVSEIKGPICHGFNLFPPYLDAGFLSECWENSKMPSLSAPGCG